MQACSSQPFVPLELIRLPLWRALSVSADISVRGMVCAWHAPLEITTMEAHPVSSSVIPALQAAIVPLQPLLPFCVLPGPTVPLPPLLPFSAQQERSARLLVALRCFRPAFPVLLEPIVGRGLSRPRPVLLASASVQPAAPALAIVFCVLWAPPVRCRAVFRCSVFLARFSPRGAHWPAKRATVAPTMLPLWVALHRVRCAPPISTAFRPPSRRSAPSTRVRHPALRHSLAADALPVFHAPTPSASRPPFASTRLRLILMQMSAEFAPPSLMRSPPPLASPRRRLLLAVCWTALAHAVSFRL